MDHKVAIIGVGPGREVDISGKAHSFGYLHADAYVNREDCELVACADIVPENSMKFADEFGLDQESAYENYKTLLTDINPDIVSICTPIPTHHDITIDCATHESIKAIHCEKPMADNWGSAKGMAYICDRESVQLTFGHQRRFGDPFVQANNILDNGSVGELDRIEISWGNLFDNGTHMLDLASMYNGDSDPIWVIGQIDYREENKRYGVRTADQAFVSWQYKNDVHGIAATGDGVELTGGDFDFYDCWLRLVCSEGVIEVGARDEPALRYRRDGEEWAEVEVADEFDGRVDKAIDDIIVAINKEQKSALRAENALKTTELLFAGHESSRRRARINLPMKGIYDHPLESMVESGEIQPNG